MILKSWHKMQKGLSNMLIILHSLCTKPGWQSANVNTLFPYNIIHGVLLVSVLAPLAHISLELVIAGCVDYYLKNKNVEVVDSGKQYSRNGYQVCLQSDIDWALMRQFAHPYNPECCAKETCMLRLRRVVVFEPEFWVKSGLTSGWTTIAQEEG
ncbi:hypothetical protein FA15DRAFT_658769 [Coprinopsis marcescibilis]|uniref:Uncharacterized protein n=1 Tax=Coprinopsis marcescibilis TaxID=230819 RepID=A0A5C3KLK9_COPMA|nr:hypothetical protein FA15DRAFT_658769 [Coprinopsis marcescibilis]